MAEAILVDHLALRLPVNVPAAAEGFATAVHTGKSLTLALGDAVRELGFQTFTYFVTTVAAPNRESRMFTWTNAPIAWVVEYDQTGMVEYDPRFLLSQETAAPVIWDRTVVDSHPCTERFFIAAARHGLCSGIALRLFDPNHGLSGIGFNTSHPILRHDDRARIVNQLPSLMELAHFVNTHVLVAIANRKLPPWQRVRRLVLANGNAYNSSLADCRRPPSRNGSV